MVAAVAPLAPGKALVAAALPVILLVLAGRGNRACGLARLARQHPPPQGQLLLEIAGLQGRQTIGIGAMGFDQRLPYLAGLGAGREQTQEILQQRPARLRVGAGLLL